MLAARLKNIFFTMLAIKIVGISLSFVFWCYTILRSPPSSDDDDVVVTVFFLMAVFFLALIGFAVIFYKKTIRFHNFHSITSETFRTAQITMFLIGAVFWVLSELYGTEQTSLVVAGFTILSMLLIGVLHGIGSILLRILYNLPRNKLNVLALGMNSRTREFCQIVHDTPHLGAEVRGYLDVREMENAPVPYLGAIDNLGVIMRTEVIDLAFIFLPIRSFYDTVDIIIETCGFYGVTSCIVGNIFEAENVKKQPFGINDFGNIAFSSTSVDYIGLWTKRMLDVVASAIGLLLLSPMLAAVAVYIKCVSRGPVFFRQERMGLNKRTFRMLKFRTMVPDAEKRLEELDHLNEADGPAFKIANDPRLIPGGSFLRRHSLDEFPQLWNVLRGDMSLVGPRPLSRRDFDLLEEDWQRKRFSMRPGLTCIWQVSGRNEVSFMQWMRMDLEYIEKWSLGLDLVLILKTIRAVFVGTGR